MLEMVIIFVNNCLFSIFFYLGIDLRDGGKDY